MTAGENCVAELVVTAAGSRPASRPGAAVPVSYNVQPFVPPFAIHFPRSVSFLSWTTLSEDVVALLRSTLRVEHMAQYNL
jgi:hypothetical protein